LIERLAKVDEVTVLSPSEEAPLSATQLVGDMKVLVPMAGFIDLEKEQARLQKHIDKLDKDIQRVENKLGNEKFVANAPKEVIDKEKEKLASALSAKAELAIQFDKINNAD
jgi:valyl-tRNA synthetase